MKGQFLLHSKFLIQTKNEHKKSSGAAMEEPAPEPGSVRLIIAFTDESNRATMAALTV